MNSSEIASPPPPAARVNLVCTFDDAYVPHFATAAASLAASRGSEHLHIILIAGPTLTAPALTAVTHYLTELGISSEVVTLSIESVEKLPKNPIFSPLVWYRLLLPELLPHYDRVLTLDADTLVLQSLLPLFQCDIGNNLLGAVASPQQDRAHCRRIGTDPATGYFNAGILLMNLRAMREEDFTRRALQLGHEKSPTFTFAEQDVFNYLAQASWVKLHPKWNALSYLWLLPEYADDSYTTLEYATARWSPAVVHFEGGHTVKPWFYRSMHPMRHLYLLFRARTPWLLARLEGRSYLTMILRRLPLRWQYLIPRFKNWVNQQRSARA